MGPQWIKCKTICKMKVKSAIYVLSVLLIYVSCVEQKNEHASDLFLPDGFVSTIVSDSLGHARHLAINTNGDIYVKLSSTDSATGGNLAIRDTNGDGKADIIKRFGGVEKNRSYYGTGMIIHDGYLYFTSALRVYRQKLESNTLVPTAPVDTVLFDDHDHGAHWHITKPPAFDAKGNMFIPFGAPSNACQDLHTTPNGAPNGNGLDPCPELVHHGGIWKFPADKINLKQRDGTRYATGIRSVVATAVHPSDDELYIVMHGRDNLYSLFPDKYSLWQSAMLPSEEFIKIKEGGDYGWPYCYYDQLQNKKVLAPEYGGDGKITGRCDSMDAPLMGFPGHWAPNDLLFYTGDLFPERYRHGAFIAFHGSTNRAPYSQSGYFVCFVPFVNGKPTGNWEVFADGFSVLDTIPNTNDAKGRPVGLAQGPDGALYIIESVKGKLWKISFNGSKNNFGEKELVGMEHRKNSAHIKTPDVEKDNLQKGITGGEQLYNTYCGNCHQRNGEGVKGRFPPLYSNWMYVSNKKQFIDIILKGMTGPITVHDELYDGVMPANAHLSDTAIATIATYVRQHFGNSGTAILPEEVKEKRKDITK